MCSRESEKERVKQKKKKKIVPSSLKRRHTRVSQINEARGCGIEGSDKG